MTDSDFKVNYFELNRGKVFLNGENRRVNSVSQGKYRLASIITLQAPPFLPNCRLPSVVVNGILGSRGRTTNPVELCGLHKSSHSVMSESDLW